MKSYKSLSLISYFLTASSFVSAILIDDFSDQNISRHLLTRGTEVNNLTRGLIDAPLRFDPDENLLGFRISEKMSSFSYSSNECIDFSDNSKLNFNIARGPRGHLKNFFGEIILIDNMNIACRTNVDLQDVWKSTIKKQPFSVDLENPNSIYGIFDRGSIDYSIDKKDDFDLKKIKTIAIQLNIHANPVMTSLYLDSIEAVPEPFSMITLIGGTIGFIRKKRRKNN